MVTPRAATQDSLLPLLLALPAGTIAGVPAVFVRSGCTLPGDLGAFGPHVTTGEALRHAVLQTPSRLVVDIRLLPVAMADAALAALGRGGAVALVVGEDIGLLVRWCDRILHRSGRGVGWVSPAGLRGRRCLELRVEVHPGAPSWITVPLPGDEPAEAVLAAARADGIRVCESRISYRPKGTR